MGIDMTSGYPKSLRAWIAASFGLELGIGGPRVRDDVDGIGLWS
jgi:hypothetical protein